ncbi:MAG: DNA polymerase III subunit delta' [Cyanophyceae cyanobacterium]
MPDSFNELIGQNEAVELLVQAVASGRVAPAYLFAGPPGVGRTLAAREFSQLLLAPAAASSEERSLANHPDFLWVEPTYTHQGNYLTASQAAQAGLNRKAPPQIRIEQVRDVARFLSRPPLEASRSVVVIEEAQAMTEAAANGLLKTLEEPGQATIILIAPGTDALLPTLVSRCQQIPFRRLSRRHLQQVLQAQGSELQQPFLLEIAQGSPGEALAAESQLQAIPQKLRQSLQAPPQSALAALTLAKTIDRELDTLAQLWLLDYLQYCYWHQWRQKTAIELLEHARHCLLNFVQPRLVWEVTLLQLSQSAVGAGEAACAAGKGETVPDGTGKGK